MAPDEATFHSVDLHISETLQQCLGHAPSNLKLDYRPLPELLRQARLMATVSSTAFFDALDLGCKPVVMADFGSIPPMATMCLPEVVSGHAWMPSRI